MLLLVAVCVVVCHAAPVDNNDAEAAKSKRGLHLGIGYHAPLVSHSYIAPAPVIAHAPIIAHAPLIAHAAPLYTSHHILPAYHSYHHYK
ncbi:uncharacterized protein LOC133324974, partial [Musca vetustissima]|uniref:uncharacterized protein LOC133324974 n=1 Tax=Musca vetustissima TaxID=27455 RepID=UPI002AB7C843